MPINSIKDAVYISAGGLDRVLPASRCPARRWEGRARAHLGAPGDRVEWPGESSGGQPATIKSASSASKVLTLRCAVLAGSGEGRGVAGPRTCASQHRQHSTLATKTPRKVICTPATSLKKRRRSVCCGEESSRQPRLGGYITSVREASRRQDWARPGQWQWQWARPFCCDFSLCKDS